MMRLFPSEPDFQPGEKGFKDTDENTQPFDLLQREDVGRQLSDLLERVDQPLVVALDGEWGTGKSHFLKLWVGAHTHENSGTASVVYFDAFAHDYLDDPLISLIGSIAESRRASRFIKTLKKTGLQLAKTATRVAIAGATGGISELAVAAVDPVIAATGDELEKLADDFWKREEGRRAAMAKFREALKGLTKGSAGKPKKLIIVVDELDRCRPDFALNLLEVIKHFFTLDNVHFVLGVNLEALAHSVRARYGQAYDAERYLQKFVHLTMKLPQSDPRVSTYSPAAVYLAGITKTHDLGEFGREVAQQLDMVTVSRVVSLRDVQRIVAYLKLIPKSQNLSEIWRSLVVTAVFFRVLDASLYRALRSKSLDIASVEGFYGNPNRDETQPHYRTFLMDMWRAILLEDRDPAASQLLRAQLKLPHWSPIAHHLETVLLQRVDAFSLTS